MAEELLIRLRQQHIVKRKTEKGGWKPVPHQPEFVRFTDALNWISEKGMLGEYTIVDTHFKEEFSPQGGSLSGDRASKAKAPKAPKK